MPFCATFFLQYIARGSVGVADVNTTAYHGTTKCSAQDIIKTQKFKHSQKDSEWLGSGVYFFAYKYPAFQWALNMAANKKTTPAVLSVDLQYDCTNLLDLDDQQTLRQFNYFIKKCLKRGDKLIQIDFDTLEKHKKWCFCCNLYRRFYPEIRVISYTFSGYTNETTLFQTNQKQICVSDDTIITSIRLEA